MILVNGKPKDSISVKDRSFQYGDGCFTTMLTVDGKIQNWPLHIERMEACLSLLRIKLPDWKVIEGWLNDIATTDPYAGLKLHISRGEGGRGYSATGANEPVVTVSSFPFPAHYLDWRENGVELGVCERRLGHTPMLAGHKHNNRLEQVLLKAEADESGYPDAVVLDINGHVVETTMANLFWVKGQKLYTPSMEHCGVAGTIRRLIIQDAKSNGLKVLVGDFELDHLNSADEVFMTNSVLGVAPVTKINNKAFPIGPITRRFQESQSS
ncbi:aminodeoxychorismate lyase [Vibrio hannami]|uniref:aminodeoxychorismate lyase n=1 Tax=Vibrio hannami TaxID=2717094 RepID=UPI00240F2207|nr:aminodeoxychorismate lyase [Vibrio hannami]MDG3087627.1 aminodeoxychorismate lyase [Vibrio hannami]